MPIDGEILLWLLCGGGLLMAALLQSEDGARRLFRRTRSTAIRSFEDGKTGKIVGRLSYLGEPLRSPLTGRPCAFYEIIVEEYKNHLGLTSGGWQRVIRDAQGQDFLIDDGTGRAIVDPTDPEVVITIDAQTSSGMTDDPTVREMDFLKSHGFVGKGWVFNKTLRYREGILESGESVAVMGRGTLEPDPDGANGVTGYRDGPPMRVRLRSSSKRPLLISDDTTMLR
ncbi:MAG: hypothetical protein GY811_11585 [Myxococcales bacterium]|nr:hypothetical protein [Myxococcales bacterium]